MGPQPPVRVSYVIPPPTQTPPRLVLPPLGTDRNGSIRPILVQAPPSTARQSHRDSKPRTQSHPRHRLGISSLALDVSTQLQGRYTPEAILYTGGRDGQLIAWDLGLKTKQRRHAYGHPERGVGWRKDRWEMLTGWSDDMDEEDDEDEEVVGSDGDVLGDVVDVTGTKQRKSSVLAGAVLPEDAWELDTDAGPAPPSAFRQCIQTHTDWINDILLCNLNQTVVSASSDSSIRAWSPHLSSSIEPMLVGTHDDYARCLAASPHQPWIASGSFDRTIKLWDLSRTGSPNLTTSSTDSPIPISTLSLSTPSQKASIYAIATDRFGSLIASGSPERVVRMWDPRSGKRTGKLVGHTDNIRAIILSNDGRYLLTGSADASIKLWSLTSQRCLHTFAHHTDSVWALTSQHPSLEIFYSGDRSGIVCRVDMEGCNTVDEGECLVVCNTTRVLDTDNSGSDSPTGVSEDIFRLQDSAGVNGIVTMDDRLIWTATGSSHVKRWKAPSRRSLRTGLHSLLASPLQSAGGVSSPSRRTSGSSDVYSPRRGFSMGMESPRPLDENVPPMTSPTSPRSGRHLSTSSAHFVDHMAQDDTALYGIPYISLVRLVSPNDSYALGSTVHGNRFRGRGDLDVATLYSAASVKSIPLPVTRPSHPPLSSIPPNSAMHPTFRQNTGNTLSPHISMDHPDASWTPRAEYELRDLAATAIPFELHPDDNIQGEQGIVRSIILNDRMHALTINTAGCVAIWDIARCRCVGWYDRDEIIAAMGARGTDGSTESENEFHSPRELLETVRERIEGECVIAPWSTVDTRIGSLIIHLSERCFETEIYSDEAGYGSERYYDIEQRLNVAKWVLSNIFEKFVKEELRHIRRIIANAPNQRSPGDTKLSNAHPETRIRTVSTRSVASNGSNTSRSAISTIITAPSIAPAILPDMTLVINRQKSIASGASLIPIAGSTDGKLPTIPQSPLTSDTTAGVPTPRLRAVNETTTFSRSTPTKETDYFSTKTKRLSTTATTADDFSGWGGPNAKEKEKELNAPQTPSTPGGGGFIGRLRQFGKSSKRPLSDDIANTAEGSAAQRNSGSDGFNKNDQLNGAGPETEQSRFLSSLTSQNCHPPTSSDTPPLNLPMDTEIVLAEETPFGWMNTYRGTVATTGQDVHLLENNMPMWLMQYLLTNKSAIVPNIKVSFGVALWSAKSAMTDADGSIQPSRLTANRHLRVRKILAYVQDKIDRSPSQSVSRSGSISGATPRSSADTPCISRATNDSSSIQHSSSSIHQTDIDASSKKSLPEDVYELLCNDTVLPLNMTLASIRHYVWRSSAELLLFYRRKQ